MPELVTSLLNLCYFSAIFLITAPEASLLSQLFQWRISLIPVPELVTSVLSLIFQCCISLSTVPELVTSLLSLLSQCYISDYSAWSCYFTVAICYFSALSIWLNFLHQCYLCYVSTTSYFSALSLWIQCLNSLCQCHLVFQCSLSLNTVPELVMSVPPGISVLCLFEYSAWTRYVSATWYFSALFEYSAWTCYVSATWYFSALFEYSAWTCYVSATCYFSATSSFLAVPDGIVLNILKERLCQLDCQTRGWVLSGYPRTREQAEQLDKAGLAPNRLVSSRVDSISYFLCVCVCPFLSCCCYPCCPLSKFSITYALHCQSSSLPVFSIAQVLHCICSPLPMFSIAQVLPYICSPLSKFSITYVHHCSSCSSHIFSILQVLHYLLLQVLHRHMFWFPSSPLHNALHCPNSPLPTKFLSTYALHCLSFQWWLWQIVTTWMAEKAEFPHKMQ